MKYLVYTLLTFVSLLLFLPRTGTSGIRNLPLLITLVSLFVLFWTIKFIQRTVLISKAKKALIESGAMICRTSVFPNFLSVKGIYDITAKRKDVIVNINIILRRRAYYHYHFKRPDRLEYYVTTRTAVSGKNRAYMAKNTLVKCAGKTHLSFDIKEDEEYVLIFDKYPARISDRNSAELFSADRIDGRVLLLSADTVDMLKDI